MYMIQELSCSDEYVHLLHFLALFMPHVFVDIWFSLFVVKGLNCNLFFILWRFLFMQLPLWLKGKGRRFSRVIHTEKHAFWVWGDFSALLLWPQCSFLFSISWSQNSPPTISLPLTTASWIQLLTQYLQLSCLSDRPLNCDRHHTDPPQGRCASPIRRWWYLGPYRSCQP